MARTRIVKKNSFRIRFEEPGVTSVGAIRYLEVWWLNGSFDVTTTTTGPRLSKGNMRALARWLNDRAK